MLKTILKIICLHPPAGMKNVSADNLVDTKELFLQFIYYLNMTQFYIKCMIFEIRCYWTLYPHAHFTLLLFLNEKEIQFKALKLAFMFQLTVGLNVLSEQRMDWESNEQSDKTTYATFVSFFFFCFLFFVFYLSTINDRMRLEMVDFVCVYNLQYDHKTNRTDWDFNAIFFHFCSAFALFSITLCTQPISESINCTLNNERSLFKFFFSFESICPLYHIIISNGLEFRFRIYEIEL